MKLAEALESLNTDQIDKDARVAALSAVAEALKIYEQAPHFTEEQRKQILVKQFRAARRDLDCYVRSEADEAFSRAISAVHDEFGAA